MKASNSSLLTIIFATVTSFSHAQGPLNPPTTADEATGPNPPLVGGNPAPTMKTLHQVEPRVPISAATTPGDAQNEYIITARGSYYLTGNLNAGVKNGIRITTGDVTLDLNGFVIAVGSSSSAGVVLETDSHRCTVKNGSIFSIGYGIFRFISGSDMAEGGSYENLTVNGTSLTGLIGGNGWTVDNCRIQGGENTGISVGNGSVVRNCTVTGMNAAAGTNGIRVGEGSVIKDSTVTDCDVIFGFSADNGSIIEGCVARNLVSTLGAGDTSAGIFCDSRGVIRNCVSSEITSSSSGQRFGAGIFANFSSLVVDCKTGDNGGAGIVINQGTVVRGCNTTSNGGAGIFAYDYNSGASGLNKLIGNSSAFNPVGFDLDTAGTLVVQNVLTSNTSNFQAVANNRIGTVVIPTNSGAVTGVGTTASGVGTTDPWANFSY